MNTFLITFQTENIENEQILVNNIKRIGKWARITRNTYCIKVENLSTADIRDRIKSPIDERCIVFVVEISHSNWASFRLNAVITDWLKGV